MIFSVTATKGNASSRILPNKPITTKEKGANYLAPKRSSLPQMTIPPPHAASLPFSAYEKTKFPCRLSAFHKLMTRMSAEVFEIPHCTRVCRKYSQ